MSYGSGFLIFIMIQFDVEYKRNWQTTILIALLGIIGANQRFHPKYFPLKLFYVTYLLVMFVVCQAMFIWDFRYFKEPTQYPQISTIVDINENGLRLSGTQDVLDLIALFLLFSVQTITN